MVSRKNNWKMEYNTNYCLCIRSISLISEENVSNLLNIIRFSRSPNAYISKKHEKAFRGFRFGEYLLTL